MKYKCIHCGSRLLIEEFYDGELHCSHCRCTCGSKLVIWYDEDETKVVLIEDEPEAVMGPVL